MQPMQLEYLSIILLAVSLWFSIRCIYRSRKMIRLFCEARQFDSAREQYNGRSQFDEAMVIALGSYRIETQITVFLGIPWVALAFMNVSGDMAALAALFVAVAMLTWSHITGKNACIAYCEVKHKFEESYRKTGNSLPRGI